MTDAPLAIMFGRLKDWRRVATRIRWMRQGPPVSHLPRCARYLLAMNPDGAVRPIRTSLSQDSVAVPYDAHKPRHSVRAADRLSLK